MEPNAEPTPSFPQYPKPHWVDRDTSKPLFKMIKLTHKLKSKTKPTKKSKGDVHVTHRRIGYV